MQQGVISSQPHLGSLYGTPSGMQSPGPHQSNFYGSGIPGSGIYRFFFKSANNAKGAILLDIKTRIKHEFHLLLF